MTKRRSRPKLLESDLPIELQGLPQFTKDYRRPSAPPIPCLTLTVAGYLDWGAEVQAMLGGAEFVEVLFQSGDTDNIVLKGYGDRTPGSIKCTSHGSGRRPDLHRIFIKPQLRHWGIRLRRSHLCYPKWDTGSSTLSFEVPRLGR